VSRNLALILVTALMSGCGLSDHGPRPAGPESNGKVAEAPASSIPPGGEAIAPDLLATEADLVPQTSGDPVIAAAGDIACSAAQAARVRVTGNLTRCSMRETSDLLLTTPLTAVLALGDLQYESGKLRDFKREYRKTWGRVLAITHPTVGNHEYLTRGAAGYFAYFGRRAGSPGHGYYSYNIGAWHLISLNSNCVQVRGCDAGSRQGRWLAADLRANRNRCTLAYWHHPRFSSGIHGDQPQTGPFWNALYAAGADVVLVGHDHDYERFVPLTPAGRPDRKRGIRQFVVGTGGKNRDRFKKVRSGSVRRSAKSFGVLMLTLHKTSYEWRFVATADSNFTDTGKGTCHS
jgi:hypothetical protein